MQHRKNAFKSVSNLSMVLALTLLSAGCIDERYDLNRGLSTSMTLGGDSLAIPLGKTDTIKLGDFLSSKNVELLKTMEDGGYALSVKDSLDVDIPKIDQSTLNIENKTFNQSQTVNFGDMSLDAFSIPGIEINSNLDFNIETISLGNFDVGGFSNTTRFDAGMSGYTPTDLTIDDINVSGEAENVFTSITLPSYNGLPTLPLKIENQDPISVEVYENIHYSINTPPNVTGIDSVLLKENPAATFSITIQLAGAKGVIATGQVVPNLTISPTDLFVFNNLPADGKIHFDPKDSLTVNNDFTIKSDNYTISELNIEGNPNEKNILEVVSQLATKGTISMNDVYVWSDKLGNVANMDLIVSVSVNNMVIKSMVFNIPPINTTLSGNTELNIDNSIPSTILEVNTIYFDTEKNTISILLKADNLPKMINSSFTINELSLHFPNEFKFTPPLSNNEYKLTNVSFDSKEGYLITLKLDQLDLNNVNITNDRFKWDGQVTYTGDVSFQGRINSANIPPAGENDTKISLDIHSDLGFETADIITNDIDIDLEPIEIPVSFNIEISDRVKRLDTLQLKPGTMARIQITKPNIPLKIAGNPLTIAFPSLFSFKTFMMENSYVIPDTVPNLIELELSTLNINRDLVEGKLVLNSKIRIGGKIQLRSGAVNTAQVENLSKETLLLRTYTDVLSISSTPLKLNALSTNFEDSTVLALPSINLPEEIVSIDSILLAENANLELDINITDMPKLDKPLIATIEMEFPSLLGFLPGLADQNNKITINQPFVNNRLQKTIGLRRLIFDGSNLGSKLDINEKIKYKVRITIDEATVKSEELTSKPITVNIDVTLAGMQFESVYGKLDPGIEPITQSISISGLPEFMQNEDVTLDVTKPVITLETECNLGIPIIIDLDMKPIRKGTVLSEAAQTVQFKMPKALTTNIPRLTRFWIAPDSAGKPVDYVFVQADIQKLFKTIPDNIQLEIKASADVLEQHFINLTADYLMNVKYEVTVPFAFGEALNIPLRDTISGLDPMIGESALSGNCLELLGTFQNSIPLELELELVPLDKENIPIDVVPVRQLIHAGAKDGSATTSNLTIKLNDPNGKLKDLRGFELRFKASSNSTVAGTPIRPDNYIIAELKARLSGGITIGDN